MSILFKNTSKLYIPDTADVSGLGMPIEINKSVAIEIPVKSGMR